jgi:hypothetical protein
VVLYDFIEDNRGWQNTDIEKKAKTNEILGSRGPLDFWSFRRIWNMNNKNPYSI